MHERHKSGSIGIGVICSAIASVALGSTTNYTARSAFLAAVPPVSSITFITVAPNSILTNQFSALGVTFSEGDDRVVTEAGFVTDGVGVTGDAVSQNIDSITLQFSQPITAIGCDFPGALGIRLFSGATEVAYSGQFGSIGSGLDCWCKNA
jgi:hypothetical protein